jgi:N6-adenosine-specific RNA methylase IME4
MSAWEFTPKTEIVWIKQTTTGKRAFGMGRIVRGEHEICMVGTRGRPQVSSRSVRSTFAAPSVPYGKPDEFYSLVHELYPLATWYDRTNKAWNQGWKKFTDIQRLAHAVHE